MHRKIRGRGRSVQSGIDCDSYAVLRGVAWPSLNTDALALRLAQTDSADDPIKTMIQTNLKASCTVMVYGNNEQWTGSGFHIGGGLIVTAAHVVPDEIRVEIVVSFDSQTLYPAKLVASDETIDVSIIYCAPIAETIASAKLGNSETVEIGDIIATISSPEGWHDTATVGRISNIHQGLGEYAPTPAWNDIIFIDADILQGSSGGMVIATDGLVVGSIMGVTGQHAELGLGQRAICPSNKIHKMLRSLDSSRT